MDRKKTHPQNVIEYQSSISKQRIPALANSPKYFYIPTHLKVVFLRTFLTQKIYMTKLHDN